MSAESTYPKRELFSADQVQEGVSRVAREVFGYFKDENVDNPLFIALLNGAVPFAIDFMREIHQVAKQDPQSNFDPKLRYLDVKTYGNSTVASSTRLTVPDWAQTVNGRRILILDDVLDTGRTAAVVGENLLAYGAKPPIETCTLVQKFETLGGKPLGALATFHALDAGPEWLIGMGMDGDLTAPKGSDAARWEKSIYVVDEPR